MQGKQSGQIDIFNQMIYESLIPKDHLLVQIDKIVHFDFVRDIIKHKYSKVGRKSYDPVLMFKICLLQYLYNLSDREVESRMQTDIAFRWFLKLELKDKTPDYTTISDFRINKLGENICGEYFQAIVLQCIEYGLVKTRRYLIDTTNVDAKVNYPSAKKLVCQSYYRVINELSKIDKREADSLKTRFDLDIETAHEEAENEGTLAEKPVSIPVAIYCEIAKKYAEEIFLAYNEEILTRKKLGEFFTILWDIIEDYCEGSSEKDRIISAIDPEAKIAHKRRGVRKRGYKEHIIVDEDSEIIIASIETPFNIPDEKKLQDLVEKAEQDYGLKPEELSADKAYGSISNRAYLKDKDIVGNILFYKEKDKEYKKYEITEFQISKDLKSATCPNNCTTNDYSIIAKGEKVSIKFLEKDCLNCPLRKNCFTESDLKKGKKRRNLIIPIRYDAVLAAVERNKTKEFINAINRRYIVERRFATLVRNHGLRVSRYLRLKGASIHITLANIACNIIRMVKLLTASTHLGEVMPQNEC